MHLKRTVFILLAGILAITPASALFPDEQDKIVDGVVLHRPAGEKVVHTAMKYVGVRYRKGGSGPKNFDCSGFTSFVYRQKNIALTRSSRTQYKEGVPVKKIADLRPGDLVFFSGSRQSQVVGHVGIVKELNADSSDFSFVHASRTGVKVDVLSSTYYKKRYLGARRVL